MSLEIIGIHGLLLCHPLKGIGKLDLSSRALFLIGQILKDIRRKDISSEDRNVRRSFLHGGLLHKIPYLVYPVVHGLSIHYSILEGKLMRNGLHSEDA